MPVQTSYPGVYVEEIPSGVRTITGVATSITAFVGRAQCGPVNVATTINSFGDFERIFGGLWKDSTLGFAVRDFYLNGGQKAIIVRLYRPESAATKEGEASAEGGAGGAPQPATTGNGGNAAPAAGTGPTTSTGAATPAAPSGAPAPVAAAPNTKPSKAIIAVGELKFEAADEGVWGQNLRIRLDRDVFEAAATAMGLTKADLFNLTVRDSLYGTTEHFLNLSIKDSPRRVDKVLKAESKLIRWKGEPPTDSSPKIPDAAIGDDVTEAEKSLVSAKAALEAAQKKDPSNSTTIDAAKTAETDAKKVLIDALEAIASSDGIGLELSDFDPQNGRRDKRGLYALEKADLFNLLCLPPYKNGDVDVGLVAIAAPYCESRRAMLLVDPPSDWKDKSTAVEKFNDATTDYVGTRSKNAALFFPRLRQPNPLRDNQLEDFAPCGTVAGIFARTDTERGVWKAPAGLDAALRGVPQLSVPLTDAENGELNPLGVNCLRARPAAGRVVWGARTLQGDDRLASEWKYIPVRRTALYIEESLYRGTQWVVFEPNDEPLWAQIRLNIGAFMHGLFRQGAFQGQSPKDAYFVKCDKETTPQDQINLGIVNIVVGFAPLKPAEFVIIKLQQMAGQIET